MPLENRFKRSVIVTLAKRAANRCSNPDCGAITSGPADNPNDSINVGEAAHIYGANPGSARFNPSMPPVERSDISNAIWLCSNCHKLIDDDPLRHPAGLLFEWQREHEHKIAEQVGKAGTEIRHRYEKRHLEEFGRLSYIAERLIIEKDDSWEYRLTAEVLRFEMEPILRRWRALKHHLYAKPTKRISRDEFIPWIQDKNTELQYISTAFSELLNGEFARAWGDPGVPGNDLEIVSTCRLFAELCQSGLHWEESVRFVTTDDVFTELLSLYAGVAGTIIDQASELPHFFSNMFSSGSPHPGKYELNIIISLPEGWTDSVKTAFERLASVMQ